MREGGRKTGWVKNPLPPPPYRAPPLKGEANTNHMNTTEIKTKKEFTDEELKGIINSEYRRMAVLIFVILAVVGLYLYSQWSYDTNFLESL